MDFKRVLVFGLSTLFSMTTPQVQASYSCQKSVCCVSPASTMHGYVDIGLGKAFHAHLPSSKNNISFDGDGQLNLSLSPYEKFYKDNFFMELGLGWFQPFLKNSPYFPFVNLGLRYQANNLNEQMTLMGLSVSTSGFKPDYQQNNINRTFPLDSEQEFIFSQDSLLMTFKLDLYRCDYLMPYINGGFGTTWHKVIQKSHFDQQSKGIADSRYISDYRTNKELMYSAGVGVDFLVTESFWLSLGYQYNYYGDISVNSNFIGVTPGGLDILGEIKYQLMEKNFFKTLFKPFQFNGLSTQTIQLTGRYVFG